MEIDKVSVLVVDDDPAIRQLCADVLEDEGYKVNTASNGQEALELIQRDGIQVALVDIMMPVMDGIQLCQILKSQEQTRRMPVIMMSAASNLMSKVSSGLADGVLVKPFEIDRLLSCVAEAAS